MTELSPAGGAHRATGIPGGEIRPEKNFFQFRQPGSPLYTWGYGSIERGDYSLSFLIEAPTQSSEESPHYYNLVAYVEGKREVVAVMWGDSIEPHTLSTFSIKCLSDLWPYEEEISAGIWRAPYWEMQLPEAPSERRCPAAPRTAAVHTAMW